MNFSWLLLLLSFLSYTIYADIFRKNGDRKVKDNLGKNDSKNHPVKGNVKKITSNNRSNVNKRIPNSKNSSVVKVDEMPNKTTSKKLKISMVIAFVLLVLLIFRLFWIQIVQGSDLKEMAYNQQTINRIISPARGTIYDSTGKALAISSRVDTVTINPRKNSIFQW